MKKIYKQVRRGDDTLTIFGSNRSIQLHDAVSPWEREQAKDEGREPDVCQCFNYRGQRYFLDEFMRIDSNAPDWMKEFHGGLNDSFFSGVLVKLNNDGETVKAYTFFG